MRTIGKISILLISIYFARCIYLSRKSSIIELNEARLFDAAELGTVNEYPVDRRIEAVADGVYAAIDYALANSILITRNNKWFIIDTTENCRVMKQILNDFESKVGKPTKIEGIIMTHFHPDHAYGAGAIIKYAKALGQNDVPVYAHDTFVKESKRYTHVIQQAMMRGAGQFGQFMEEKKQIHAGLGHRLMFNQDEICPYKPTHTFGHEMQIQFENLTFNLFHAPGETDDQIAVYVPELKLLCPADDVYPHFPNIYPIRGAPARSVRQWCDTVYNFTLLDVETMIGCHGPAVHGAEKIQDILHSYHDAMKYVHDQTVRHMELLKNLDDIVRAVKLPKQLAEHPWLPQTYGRVEWAVRGVYDAYIGWFDGHSRNLRPLHHTEYSQNIVRLTGGAKIIAAEIHTAIEESTNCKKNIDCIHNKLQWALQLIDNVLAANLPDDFSVLDSKYMPRTLTHEEFVKTKIYILTELGHAQSNPTARNWYLNDALETQTGVIPRISDSALKTGMYANTVDLILNVMESKLHSEEALANWDNRCILFHLSDREHYYKIRNGVFVSQKGAPCGTIHHGIVTTERHFKDLLGSPLDALTNFVKGNYEIIGSTPDFISLLLLFK